MLNTFEQTCEVIGGSDLAQVDLSFREKLIKVVTRGSAEAVAAASKRGVLLWTDDQLLYELVRGDLPSPRIWTQIVFAWAAQAGIVDRKIESQVTARMLRFGYSFTSLSTRAVLDTCEAASWRPEDPDLGAVLADFGNPRWEYEVARGITAETVARIWQQAPTEEHARMVTARLLVHLADRQDHSRILQFLIRNVESLLGLALTREASLREMLQVFLQGGVPTL